MFKRRQEIQAKMLNKRDPRKDPKAWDVLSLPHGSLQVIKHANGKVWYTLNSWQYLSTLPKWRDRMKVAEVIYIDET